MAIFILFIALTLREAAGAVTYCQHQWVHGSVRGVIESPNYPQYIDEPTCLKWTMYPCNYVSCESTGGVLFSFDDYDLPTDGYGCKNHVQIDSTYYHKSICRTAYRRLVYRSIGRSVTVTFNYTKATPSRGFRLSYVFIGRRGCYDDEYTCGDGQCIPYDWVCNGVSECAGGDDERSCVRAAIEPFSSPSSFACNVSTFGCTSANDYQYRCYPNRYRCDGDRLCVLGQDERQCDSKAISESCSRSVSGRAGSINSVTDAQTYRAGSRCSYHVQVSRGERVQLRFVRFQLRAGDTLRIFDGPSDKYALLYDSFGRDRLPPDVLTARGDKVYVEYVINSGYRSFNITFQEKGYCLAGQLPCKWGEVDCYETSRRCNAHWDCPLHGGDERGCHDCASHLFACVSRHACYAEADRCDGMHKCTDRSDEYNCTADKCNADNGTFLCANKRCIYESWMCDRADDCGDGSDERHCPRAPSRRVITAAVIGSLLCALLLAIAIGGTCKLHAHRMNQMTGSYARYMTPMCEVEQEIWARQSAPPLYDEAMRTSRPFDEAQRDLLARTTAAMATPRDTPAQPITTQMLSDALGGIPPPPPHTSAQVPVADPSVANTSMSDDELLDISDAAPVAQAPAAAAAVGDVELVVRTGAKAQWRRSRSKSSDDGGATEQQSGDASCSAHCDSSRKPATAHVTDVMPLQPLTAAQPPPHKTQATTSRHGDGATTTDIDDVSDQVACDNQAFIGDDGGADDVMLMRRVVGPPDGASIDDGSETSLIDGDGDMSMLSLD